MTTLLSPFASAVTLFALRSNYGTIGADDIVLYLLNEVLRACEYHAAVSQTVQPKQWMLRLQNGMLREFASQSDILKSDPLFQSDSPPATGTVAEFLDTALTKIEEAAETCLLHAIALRLQCLMLRYAEYGHSS